MILLREVALSCLNIPYIYGGNNPLTGMDCSGFIQHVLHSCGLDPVGDQSAQGLYDHFADKGTWNRLRMGSLLFFGKSVSEVSHVALALDIYRMCEAGGGDHTCTTLEIAKEKGAFVKVSMIKRRSDLVATIFPNYSTVGML